MKPNRTTKVRLILLSGIVKSDGKIEELEKERLEIGISLFVGLKITLKLTRAWLVHKWQQHLVVTLALTTA